MAGGLRIAERDLPKENSDATSSLPKLFVDFHLTG